MHYRIIMDNGYGDIRIFLLNNYNEKVWKSIKSLFKSHTMLAAVPSSGGYVNRKGGWMMDKEDLINQIYLSEYGFDGEEDWEKYKGEMKSFIEEYVFE